MEGLSEFCQPGLHVLAHQLLGTLPLSCGLAQDHEQEGDEEEGAGHVEDSEVLADEADDHDDVDEDEVVEGEGDRLGLGDEVFDGVAHEWKL